MNILFGQVSEGVTLEENVGRRTQVPVYKNDPPVEMQHAPDWNEVSTDPNPHLGFVNRSVAGDWHEGEQYVPVHKEEVDNQYLHNAIVDRQVSTSGTAAAREASGEWGHGTMKHSIAIEPTGDLRDGGKLGNDYFKRDDRKIQEVMGNEMSTAPGIDTDTRGAVMGAGKDNALQAKMDSGYQAWYNATVGG